MTKAERFIKELDAEMAATPPAPPMQQAPPPTGPNKYDGMSRDRREMSVANIIADPQQPRKDFDEPGHQLLTQSVKQFGVLQPIRVWWNQELGKWVVRVGERRLRAAIAAGLETIPCVFVEQDGKRRQEQLVENCLRADLKPLEQAQAFRDLMEEQGWTQQQLADGLNLNQGSVSKALKLLELSPAIQADVIAGTIPPDVAGEIAKIKDPTEQENMRGAYSTGSIDRQEVRNTVKKSKTRKNKKPGKVLTYRLKACKATLTFKTIPTQEEVEEAVEELNGVIQEKRRAA